jgi:hypothetical protein
MPAQETRSPSRTIAIPVVRRPPPHCGLGERKRLDQADPLALWLSGRDILGNEYDDLGGACGIPASGLVFDGERDLSPSPPRPPHGSISPSTQSVDRARDYTLRVSLPLPVVPAANPPEAKPPHASTPSSTASWPGKPSSIATNATRTQMNSRASPPSCARNLAPVGYLEELLVEQANLSPVLSCVPPPVPAPDRRARPCLEQASGVRAPRLPGPFPRPAT